MLQDSITAYDSHGPQQWCMPLDYAKQPMATIYALGQHPMRVVVAPEAHWPVHGPQAAPQHAIYPRRTKHRNWGHKLEFGVQLENNGMLTFNGLGAEWSTRLAWAWGQGLY